MQLVHHISQSLSVQTLRLVFSKRNIFLFIYSFLFENALISDRRQYLLSTFMKQHTRDIISPEDVVTFFNVCIALARQVFNVKVPS